MEEPVELEELTQEKWFLWKQLRVKLVYVSRKDWEQEIKRLRGRTG